MKVGNRTSCGERTESEYLGIRAEDQLHESFGDQARNLSDTKDNREWGIVNCAKSFTYYEPGIPCHLCLVYGQFRFGARERLLIVTRKVSLR